MRLLPMLFLLLATLDILVLAAENATKSGVRRKTLRMVKKLKKSKTGKNTEQHKSESYRVPIIISAPPDVSPHDIPVSIELHDDDRYIKSAADLHPIEPIHLVPIGEHPRRMQEPSYYNPHSDGNDQLEQVYHGPVAVPVDYPYGSSETTHPNDGVADFDLRMEMMELGPSEHAPKSHYEPKNELSLNDYYPDNYGDLSAIPGSPGLDYPTYSHLPETGFKCLHHTSTPGFYADVETNCQMWHYCQPDGRHDRFLCPNGTVFDQVTRVCNWWFNVYCDSSLANYDINFDLYREPVKRIQPKIPQTPIYHQEAKPFQAQASVYQHEANPSHPENTVATPNSFLRHLEDFEAGLRKIQPGDSYKDYAQLDRYSGPVESAASPHELRYPIKLAPAPKVMHDQDGLINYESSNTYTQSTPVEKLKKLGSRKRVQKKRVGKNKVRKHPKALAKRVEDDIPTYREAKATPAARRYRVVRRRKILRN